MKLRIALLAALALLLVPAAATASIAQKRTTASAQSATDYWTKARMRAAIPADVGVVGDGDPVAAEPARGGGVRAEQVADPSAADVRMHGRAFFRIGRANYVCSGTVVGSKTDSTVITAGHCVEEGRSGGFAKRWIFVPAYQDGEAPYGEWSATRLATTPQFARAGDLSYDVGAAKIAARGGQKIAEAVGARKVAFGQAPRQITTYGYPATRNTATGQGFDGEKEWSCASALRGRDKAGRGPKTMQIGCDMTAGASGGGWVDADGNVIGVLSYVLRSPDKWNNRDNNSPFLGGAARKVLRAVAR